MTTIVGLIKDSSGVLNGRLSVTLDAPLVDTSTNPDSVLYPIASNFEITNGIVNINLPQTETAGITVLFAFSKYDVQLVQYFRFDGTEYFGPANQHTDSKWYTGQFFVAGVSEELNRQVGDRLVPVFSFSAVVPNVPTVELANLNPSGISTDRLASGSRQIATLLAYDLSYQEVIGDAILNFTGDYQSDRFYSPREAVFYDGGSWVSIFPQPHAGNTPVIGSTYWSAIALRGATGTGTSGNDTAYNAAGWDGQTDAPSRNAVRDIVETLAPKVSPTFTGTVAVPTPTSGDQTTKPAPTIWVIPRINEAIAAATFTTQPAGANDTTPATTAFVKTVVARYSKVAGLFTSGTNGGSAIAGTVTRTLNTIIANGGDIVSLNTNQVTLRAGTYLVDAYALAYRVNAHRISVWNATTNTRLLTGAASFSNTNDTTGTTAVLSDRLVLASDTVLELRHFFGMAQATNGLGLPVSEAGISENYAAIEFQRID